jgi:site-specific DNA-methyltransferase (adenine-specific)
MSICILQGDCREVLKTLPAGSVHCCVTSPPYFGLRDYGNAAQIGLEPTPAEYVAQMVAVFSEVRRVLRDDGTLWLNLGDSYAGSWGARGRGEGTNAARPDWEEKHGTAAPGRHGFRDQGIKLKDLIGIPWMVAFALRADGWYLRQDIIWHKPNPMPESVRDRCTKAHEYVFLLSKQERYYFNAEAMQEPAVGANEHDLTGRTKQRLAGNVKPPKGQAAYEAGDELQRTKAGLLDYAQRQRSKRDSFKRDDSKRADVIPGQSVGTHRADRDESAWDTATRNKRSVWTIATKPFSEAHFATMAPELAETCIKAGCPEGGTVLDPFGGAGTTGLVADQLQRSAVLCELSADYIDIARRRIAADAPLFAEVTE